MKECPVCGHPLTDEDLVCPVCGLSVDNDLPPIPAEEGNIPDDLPPVPAEETEYPDDLPPVPEEEANETASLVPPPASPDEENAPVEKPRRNKTGLWIALSAVALLLIGGGIGVYFYLTAGHSSSIERNEERDTADSTELAADTVNEEEAPAIDSVVIAEPDPIDEYFDEREPDRYDDVAEKETPPAPQPAQQPNRHFAGTGRVYNDKSSIAVSLSLSVNGSRVSGQSVWSGNTEQLNGTMSADGHLVVNESGGSRYDGYLQGNSYKGTYYDNSGIVGSFNFYVE